MGNTDRGMDFLQLDPSSTWARENLPLHLARAGKMAEARESTKQLVTDYPEDRVISICLNKPSSAESDQEVRAASPGFLADPDPENRYWTGAVVIMCGKQDIGLRLLKSAVEGRYCAYQALQNDPLLAPLRSAPEFAQLLIAARDCENKFRAETGQLPQSQ
jgi:hypothetical protein